MSQDVTKVVKPETLEDGHIAGDNVVGLKHPGNPRLYFGPLRTEPDEMFTHTAEDLKNPDHWLEFLIGNGQMTCRLDALCSQHIQGRKTRGTIGINHSDAWGAEAFPYYRCRPAGQLYNNLLLTDDQIPLDLGSISDYRQTVDIEQDVLRTSFDWAKEGCKGHTEIKAFMSQVDPNIMVLRFSDKVEEGVVKRIATVKTQVPYKYRLTNDAGEAEKPAVPNDETKYACDDIGSQWIEYSFCSDYTSTDFVWYGRAIPVGQDALDLELESWKSGEMAHMWKCPAGQKTEVDILYAVVSNRCSERPLPAATATLDNIEQEGVRQYQSRHVSEWERIWNESTLRLKNEFWQKQFEIARYTLLINTGGNWINNVAMDEHAWEAHMLDSVNAINALLEWGHLGLAKRAYDILDKMYPAAVENAKLVSEYIDEKLVDEAALLPTFLTYDGHVALYSINHFMLHSEQNSFHGLGLWKLADYLGQWDISDDMVYRWFRAYANYAILTVEWNDDLDGYVFPLWKVGTIQEGDWWYAQVKNSHIPELNSIADLFPPELKESKSDSPIDSVLTHKWILEKAAELADNSGRDEQLRSKWLAVAEKIHIPRTEKAILRHLDDDGVSKGVIPPDLYGLFYPCEGNHKQFSKDFVEASLEASFARRNPFIASWSSIFYSTAYAIVNNAEAAWQMLETLLVVQDHRCIQAQDNFGVKGFAYYYFNNQACLLVALRNMFLRYQDGQVVLFPAVPKALKDGVEFENLPIGGGMRVSANLCGEQGKATIIDSSDNIKVTVCGKIRGFTISRDNLLCSDGKWINIPDK